MTTYLGKSCSFCLPRVPFVNCRQFMYLVFEGRIWDLIVSVPDHCKSFYFVNYCSATHMPITRLYIPDLLPTGPLPDCILLFCYQQAHYQTVYFWSATNRPITRLFTTVLLPKCPLPDCILLFCYPHAHYQTVYYCSATNMPSTRLFTTVLLPTCPLPDCIPLVC